MQKIVTIGLLSYILLAAQIATGEWYVGADTIENQAIPYLDSLNSDSVSIFKRDKDKEDGLSLTGGYRTNKFFAVQLEYQDDLAFGIDNMFTGSSLWFPESESAAYESSGLFLSGISSYPINESTSLYMKGGIFNWEIDSKNDDNNDELLKRARGTDIFYGFGANYDLNARFGISAEWERYQMEESDVDYLSTELKFKF